MTLESQYEQYKKKNPESTYTFDEWKEKVFYPMLESFARTSYNFDQEKELEDWDNTLLDGLDELPYEEDIN
jgi:hypothetical protein